MYDNGACGTVADKRGTDGQLRLPRLPAPVSRPAKPCRRMVCDDREQGRGSVCTQPQMHCESCEKKITGNLRFEKGVKQIECDIEGQRVTITYDADKTNSEAIIKSFDKFGYKATEVKGERLRVGERSSGMKAAEKKK